MATANIPIQDYSRYDASTSRRANNALTRSISSNALATFVLKKCSKTLEENLTAENILTQLFCMNVLTKAERENIRDLKTSRNRLKLNEIMMTKDERSVQDFIYVINENTSGQEFIVKELEEAVMDFKERLLENSDVQQDGGLWFQVEFPVSSFTGREAEIEKVFNSLTKSKYPITVINQITIITGLGGIGKSELARKYAHKYKNYYNNNIIWINSETRNSFRNSFEHLLYKYFSKTEEILKNMNEKEMIEIVYKHFTGKENVLLILDNIEDFNVIELLPKSLKADYKIPSVLITSRKTTWEPGVEILELNVLSEDEAIKFIQSALGKIATTEEASALANKLQCLPLALQQAVSYIRKELINNENPIQKYIEYLNKQKKCKKILNYEMSSNEKTTFNTWTVTMKILKSKEYGLLAIKLISIMAFFEPDTIPTEVLADLESNYLNEIFSNSNLEPMDKIDGAVGLLKSYSIVSGERGIINIHRLVQRVVQLKMDKNQKEKYLRQGLELLRKYMEMDFGKSYLIKHLLPHSESIWKHTLLYESLNKEYSKFPTLVCRHLIDYGRFEEALVLARDSIPAIKLAIGKKHENMIRLIYQKAKALYYLRKYTESIEIINTILELAKSKLGSDHWITLETHSLLALNLQDQGNYDHALKIYEEIEVIQIKKFGHEHANTLATLHNKASVLLEQGRLEEAEKLFNSVYGMEQRVLGENHYNTLATRFWIATVLEKKGFLKKALKEYENVYQARKRVLGEKHPDTIDTLDSINICEAKINSNTLG